MRAETDSAGRERLEINQHLRRGFALYSIVYTALLAALASVGEGQVSVENWPCLCVFFLPFRVRAHNGRSRGESDRFGK